MERIKSEGVLPYIGFVLTWRKGRWGYPDRKRATVLKRTKRRSRRIGRTKPTYRVFAEQGAKTMKMYFFLFFSVFFLFNFQFQRNANNLYKRWDTKSGSIGM